MLGACPCNPRQISVFSLLRHRETGVHWSTSTATPLEGFSSLYSSLYSHYAKRQLLIALHGSHHYVEKMELWKRLAQHQGCVNSVLFSNCGDYIFTGSDDRHVHLYDTHSGELLDKISTAHTNNIFYAKELPCNTNLGGESPLDWILTCAADGRVFLHHRPTNKNQLIYRHIGRAHRIAIPFSSCNHSNSFYAENLYHDVPGHFYTCGEDGICCLFDLRDHQRMAFVSSSNAGTSLEDSTLRRREIQTPEVKFEFKNLRDRTISIYSIGVNPNNAYEVALSGELGALSLFDVRKPDNAFGYLCPQHSLSSIDSSHITGLKYTADGKMLIASYNDENIYSFIIQDHQRGDLKADTNRSSARSAATGPSGCDGDTTRKEIDDDELKEVDANTGVDSPRDNYSAAGENEANCGYYQKYSGHRNTDTVKQVSVFGSRSEFVVSGSDCGHIFLWDIHSAKLLKVLRGDKIGAVNCLASHPVLPLLASSGLEEDAKLWMPYGDHNPIVEGNDEWVKVDKIMKRNATGHSPFRERLISAAALRRMLLMLTGGRLYGDDDEDDDGAEEPRSSASSHSSSGVRRSREESSSREGDGENRPRRRRRTAHDDEEEEIDMDDFAALLPLIRAALGRNLMTSEDDSSVDTESGDNDDDEDDVEYDELPHHYRGMYEEGESTDEHEDGETHSEDEEDVSEWETCESEISHDNCANDPFATDED